MCGTKKTNGHHKIRDNYNINNHIPTKDGIHADQLLGPSDYLICCCRVAAGGCLCGMDSTFDLYNR